MFCELKSPSLPRSTARFGLIVARPWSVALIFMALAFALALPASAASCWVVDGWNGDDSEDAMPLTGHTADVEWQDCTIVPPGWGWVQVLASDTGPGPEDLYLLLRATGPTIAGWVGWAWIFDGALFFEETDDLGRPVVRYEASGCLGCPPQELVKAYPPKQAGKSQLLGKRVRLRHAKTGNCLYAESGNNGFTRNRPCRDEAHQTFVLDHVGSGQVRLRHEQTDQCLYTQDFDNALVHHWFCWDGSLVQRFKLSATTLLGGGFRLQNVEREQCPYGDGAAGALIRSWSCWDGANQVFKIDRLE